MLRGVANLDPRGIVKGATRHCYTQNIKALGYVGSGKNMFYVFLMVSIWELMTPKGGTIFDPGA